MTWWQRNRWGLILLLPALALAIGSASFRLINFYIPYTYLFAHPPENYRQTYSIDDKVYRVEVTVHLDAVTRSTNIQGIKPAPGVELIQVHLTFKAPPDANLGACEIGLHDRSANVYAPIGSLESYGWSPSYSCTPVDDPRPPSWPRTLLFAVPAGSQPDWLQLGWSPPDFIGLPLR